MMKKFMCVILLLYCTACASKINYGSLIQRIYTDYGTAGVIIASTADFQSFDRLTTWHEASLSLSTKNIASVIVNFDQFPERIKFYTRKTVRPLVIILIDEINELYTFSNITSRLDMSYPVWLIIFVGNETSEACDFCRSPWCNLLHLKFNSEVLVSCCESRIIDEWWFKRGDEVNTRHLAELVDERLIWLSNESLYARRPWIEDPEFRVAIVKGSGYIWHTHEKYSGVLGELLHQLSRSMNFRITSSVIESAYGIWDADKTTWTGVIGRLRRNEADIGVAEFSMTTQRLDAVDFTLPITIGDSRLYIRKPDATHVSWNAYFKAFELDVWMVIIAIILTVPLLLTLIKYNRNFHLFPMIIEHYLCIWGIYCQQGLSNFPNKTPLRIVYLSIFVSALIVNSAYSGSLISFLALSPLYLPFNTMEEFAETGGYKLIVLRDSSDYDMFKFSNETTMERMMALMKPVESLPESVMDGFRQVCNEQVVFHTNEAIKRTINTYLPCDIVSIRTGRIETLGMILPRGSQYTQLINYHIQRFKDVGMVRSLIRKYFQNVEPSEVVHSPVPLLGITPILSVLGGGTIGAVVIFAIERIIVSYSSEKRFPRNSGRRPRFPNNS